MTISRRSLLVGGIAAAAGFGTLRYGIPFVSGLVAGGFDFQDMESPPGFRHLAAGKSSTGLNPFFALESRADDGMRAMVEQVQNDICAALFGPGELPADTVPIAYFSDYNCPYCRVLTPKLAKMEDAAGGRLRISWHELPLLGELSVLASKAALAAKRQGAYVEFHKRLMRAAFLKTPEYVRRLAEEMGIDGDRMATDMESAEVQAEIRQSAALSRIFGFIGTPALVIGNTVVQGQIGEQTLARLIRQERADGPTRACV